MSTTDLVADVIDYLVTTCQASATLQALGVQVYDGPQPSGTTSGVEQALWIGHNPRSADEEIGDADQDWPVMDHGRTRDETGSIICCAKHWTGDYSLKAHRDGCKAIIAAVELELRGDAATGGPGDISLGGLVFWAQVTGVTWWQSLVDGGAEAYCAFKIGYFARLTS